MLQFAGWWDEILDPTTEMAANQIAQVSDPNTRRKDRFPPYRYLELFCITWFAR